MHSGFAYTKLISHGAFLANNGPKVLLIAILLKQCFLKGKRPQAYWWSVCLVSI